MNRKIEFNLHTKVPEWWNSEVEKNNGVYTSTSDWANLYESLGIGQGLYLEVLIDGKRSILVLLYEVLLGGVLLLNFPKIILSTIFKLNFLRSINMHLQPVFIDKNLLENENELIEISNEILKYIYSIAETRNVNIKPADFVCFRNLEGAKLLKEKSESYDLTATVRIPLNISAEEKFNSLPRNLTGHINKAKKSEAVVKEADVKVFYSELSKSWKSYGLSMNPELYYTKLAEVSKGFVKYYLAYHEENILAGSAIMFYGKTMSEFSMFTTPYSRTAKIPGGDLLKWYLIEFGIKNNYEFLDLSMIEVEENMSEKANNINSFKLKWDGYILYGVTISKLNIVTNFIRKIKLKLLGK